MSTIEADQSNYGGHSAPTVQLEGRIGSNNQAKKYDTLDEPISDTVRRDLENIWKKLLQVLLPKSEAEALRDWDLWGPLLLCLLLAAVLSLGASSSLHSSALFTGVFVIFWCGAAVVTINSKLLGGSVSILQSVCILGYCLFPLNVASILSLLISHLWVRLVFSVVGFAWATYASVGFLSETNLPNRRALAVFPIFLFYFFISWMILVF